MILKWIINATEYVVFYTQIKAYIMHNDMQTVLIGFGCQIFCFWNF